MTYRVDNAIEELDAAMKHVRETLKGIPTNVGGFKSAYSTARKATGDLLVAVTDVKPKVRL